MPVVLLPDGRKARFPDEMPKEEIRALIEHKFPDAVAKRATAPKADPSLDPTTLRDPAATPDQANQALDLPVPDGSGGTDPAFTPTDRGTAVDDWGPTPQLLPAQRNRVTGEWRPAVPQVLSDTIDAVTLPGDVATGKVDPMSNEGIGRGLGLTSLVIGGGSLPTKNALTPLRSAIPAAAKDAAKFDIPLTRGQASGELRQLGKEENLRQMDGPGQKTMRSFDDQQRQAMGTAAENIGKGMGDNADNMPGMVTQKIGDQAKFSKERTSALYNIAFDGGLTVKKEAVDQLPSRANRALQEQGVIVDPQITPVAHRALQELSNASEFAGTATSALPEGDMSLKGIEQMRKRLINLQGSTPEDRRAVRAVKGAFDSWLDESVDQSLISGDDAALNALKQARAETGVYKSILEPKRDDAGGQAVARMMKRDSTAEEVANWLYGANIASPSLNAPKVAARVRELVGPNSPEFGAVRAAAWERLVKDYRSGDIRSATVMANRIEDFLNGKGKSLAGVIFTADQRKQMQEFATVVRRTVTPRDATNPSRTSYKLAGLLDGLTRLIGGGVGFGAGGAGGAVAGALLVPVFKNVRNARAAVKAVAPMVEKTERPKNYGNALGRPGVNALVREQVQHQGGKMTTRPNALTRLDA